MRVVSAITQDEIIRQWDGVARLRANQIGEGKDLSYNFVLVPTIMKLTEKSDFSNVVDLGCGPGLLTKRLALKAQKIVGIDMSKEMINLARSYSENTTNLELTNSKVEDFANRINAPLFTLAVANMMLMTTLHLDKFLECVASMLKPKGHFIFTITHPCFWPLYHGYADKNWFDYNRETLIEDVFRISLDSPTDGPKTIHIHRPIRQYLLSILKAGFLIDHIYEPIPTKEVQAKYPKPWKYPRFLCIRCIKK